MVILYALQLFFVYVSLYPGRIRNIRSERSVCSESDFYIGVFSTHIQGTKLILKHTKCPCTLTSNVSRPDIFLAGTAGLGKLRLAGLSGHKRNCNTTGESDFEI